MSVFLLCERAVGLVRGQRLVLSSGERSMLEALNYEGLADARAQDEAVACARHFAFVRDRLLQLYPWVFARKSATPSSATKEAGWSNAYTLPSDCLNVLAVLSGGEPVEWEALSGKVLCNASSVTVRYTAKVTSESSWPPAFEDALCCSLAGEITAAVIGDAQVIQAMEQRAQLSIQRAWQMGIIQPETRIPMSDELCQRAVGLIQGQRLVGSTSEAAQANGMDHAGLLNVRSYEAVQACRRAFNNVRDRLLQLYPWVFARKTTAPAQLSASGGGWRYAFSLPTDCLKVLRVTAQTRVGHREDWPVDLAEWEVSSGQIYANRTPVYIRYTAKMPDTSTWSPAFTDVFVTSLAAEVALAVTGDARISQALEQKAQQRVQHGVETGDIRAETSLVKKHQPLIHQHEFLEYSGITPGLMAAMGNGDCWGY